MDPESLFSTLPVEVFETIFQQAFDGIAISENGKMIYVNPGLAKMYGATVEEMIGQYTYDLAQPGVSARKVRESALSGQSRTYLASSRRKDGKPLHGEVRSYPYHWNGRTLRISTLRDLTDTVVAEERLAELRTKMLFSSKAATLREIANGLAHEINNPLSVIRAYTNMLRESIEAGKARSEVEEAEERQRQLTHVAKIDATVSRITQIVRSLVVFTGDPDQEPFQQLEASTLVLDALSLSEDRLGGVRVDLELGPPGIKLECRPVPLSQVLLNLLHNAADAVEGCESKWIRVTLEDRGDEVRVAVEDSGPGVAPEMRDKIMQPFYTTKSPQQGTGLGLSISRKIVEGHRGSLKLDAQAEHTRFVVLLPKVQGACP